MRTISGKGRSVGRWVRPTVALVALAALCAAAVALVLSAKGASTAAIPLRIDGEPVEAAEYMLLLDNERAPTIAEYGERYGIEADSGASFWTTVLDGATPLDTAKRRALAQLTRIKVQQREAVSYGLLGSDSYASFLKRLEKENARRERLVATGGIVYGPTKYDLADYYDYSMSNLRNRLIEVMGPRLWPADDKTLLAFYDSVKDARYRSDGPADLSFERIRDVVRNDYWSSRFQQWTDQAAAAAKIEIDEKVYRELGY
ncbi:hypothetical protein [Cohnella rhizosphaerae]|uniref:Uncharacterized protein n=1 Tax=Cohnella rhizosphaerae TaxID=1457232 RepID=A0A9X4KVK0_9BACL|nr:hypothetical protein [Cohnella rhizosphaerae]MDG0808867.1 hypothetical protein [Cohnella rhizosphaerae]